MRSIGYALLASLVFTPVVSAESLRAKVLGFETYIASSSSMEPTIKRDEMVYVDAKAYGKATPRRGDIISFENPKYNGNIFIMRVAAVGGDRVAISKRQLIVNGKPVQEPYVDEGKVLTPYSETFEEVVVPAGAVFVLGDNRDNSNDSRLQGAFAIKTITGRVTQAKKSWLEGEFHSVK